MSTLPSLPPGHRPPSAKRQSVQQLKRSVALFDRISERLLPYDPTAQDLPDQRARPMIVVGLLLMVVLFGIIGMWAAFVPLATGAVAPGRVISESASKSIQHLEGGIVKEILVREGQKVNAGDVLVRLENVSAESRNEQIRNQYIVAKATEGRLLAEQDGAAQITFDPALSSREATDPKIKEAMDTQRRLFATRKATVEGQVSVLGQRVAQSEQEIAGLREQASSASQQIALLEQEIKVVEGLLSSGNATKPRLLALQRQQAQLSGQRGQSLALASRAGQSIQESKIAMLNLKNDMLNNVVRELKETQVQIATLDEQARASEDIVRRIDITAPIAGTVTGLAVHTVGGVIQPAATVMTLVPLEDRLIVEARVAPQDIDVVHAGLKAQVRFTAFKSRYLRPAEGTVITVSADRFEEQRTGESFYTARIEIPQESIAELGDVKLTAGMGADTLIVTGRRTMLSYILQPVRDSFGHAFHDQ